MELKVDHTALKVNQACIIVLTLLAFLFDSIAPVAFVGAVMAIGTYRRDLALFMQFYAKVLRPAGLVKADVRVDDPTPHQFAQGMGSAVLGVATIALLTGASAFGWALTLVVALLAAVNLVFNFCTGCFIYYQLGRFGITHPRSVPESRT